MSYRELVESEVDSSDLQATLDMVAGKMTDRLAKARSADDD